MGENVFIVLNDAPYGTEKTYNELRLAIALQARQDNVRLSHMVDAVSAGIPNLETPPGYYNIDEMLERVLAKGGKVGSFDTRYAGRLVKVFGFAADKIAESLISKGGIPILPAAPFYVTGKKSPLKEGELERATAWAKNLLP